MSIRDALIIAALSFVAGVVSAQIVGILKSWQRLRRSRRELASAVLMEGDTEVMWKDQGGVHRNRHVL